MYNYIVTFYELYFYLFSRHIRLFNFIQLVKSLLMTFYVFGIMPNSLAKQVAASQLETGGEVCSTVGEGKTGAGCIFP